MAGICNHGNTLAFSFGVFGFILLYRRFYEVTLFPVFIFEKKKKIYVYFLEKDLEKKIVG